MKEAEIYLFLLKFVVLLLQLFLFKLFLLKFYENYIHMYIYI